MANSDALSINELGQWFQETAAEWATGLSAAMETINESAASEAQKAEARAQAYFDKFVELSGKARATADLAAQQARPRAAEVLNRIANTFDQVRRQRLSPRALHRHLQGLWRPAGTGC